MTCHFNVAASAVPIYNFEWLFKFYNYSAGKAGLLR